MKIYISASAYMAQFRVRKNSEGGDCLMEYGMSLTGQFNWQIARWSLT